MTLNQICWAVLFGLMFLELVIVARNAAKASEQRMECERDPLAAARLLEAAQQRPVILPAPMAPEARADEPAVPPAAEAEAGSAMNHAPEAPATLGIYSGNNYFAAEKVAFTGSLKGMTRRAAMEAVEHNGGQAFSDMPAGITLLVVGDKPGKGKLDKAQRWGVRIMDAQEFFVRLSQPLTLEPDEFAALLLCLG